LQVASLSEQFNANPSEDEINPPFWVICSRKVGSVVAWGGHENHARRQLGLELIDRSSGAKDFQWLRILSLFRAVPPQLWISTHGFSVPSEERKLFALGPREEFSNTL
jgi:hypothetical protein|tara:strand:- start:392 stop:715 length:324 start_codon:yes stop_codon:yes gene_type:complete